MLRKEQYKRAFQKFLKVCMALFIVLLFAGCADRQGEAAGTKIVLTTGFEKDEIFRIEKSSCTLPELMVYLTTVKNQYEETYGAKIWETSYEGVTLEENIKETVLARIAKVKAMNLLAAKNGVALDESEKKLAEKAAETYYQSLHETEIRQLQVTQPLLQKMYEEYALANKVYEYLIADINPEISDDEARTITVQHILIKTYSLDENGKTVPYTEQAKEEAYLRAQEVSRKLRAGEDFSSLAAEYNEDSNETYSFGKGTLYENFEEAAFNLGSDEISDIVETPYGYHIIKCISTFDRDETDRNKIKIVEQRRKEVFNQEYSEFVNGLTRNMNTKLWETVGFIEDAEITTNSFFKTFHDYF